MHGLTKTALLYSFAMAAACGAPSTTDAGGRDAAQTEDAGARADAARIDGGSDMPDAGDPPLPCPTEDTTLYVDGSIGDDSIPRAANSEATPWRTIGRAAWGSTNRDEPNPDEAARAGDTVLVAAGTYETAGIDDRYHVSYNPVNSGTPGNPITFEAVGRVVLTLSSRGVAIGANERDYITWRGFTIDDSNNPMWRSDGVVVVFNSSHIVLDRMTITGRLVAPVTADNYVGIWFDGSVDCTVRNSVIENFGLTTADENSAGVTTYYSGRLLFEHNEFVNNGSGMYIKANFTGEPATDIGSITIRYNIYRGNVSAINCHRSPHSDAQPSLIHQNLFLDNEVGVRLKAFAQTAPWHGTTDPKNFRIVNNTFDGNVRAVQTQFWLVPASNNVVRNNIFTRGTWAVTYADETLGEYSADRVSFARNLAHEVLSYGLFRAEDYSLEGWRAQTGEDDDTVEMDPLYVDSAAGDFRLRAESPAQTHGRAVFGVGGADDTTIPAGAYISGSEVIGPSSVPCADTE
jgi:hypothetical protein